MNLLPVKEPSKPLIEQHDFDVKTIDFTLARLIVIFFLNLLGLTPLIAVLDYSALIHQVKKI